TSVWVLGTAVSERAVENVQERFGLSNTARQVIRHRLTGPRAGGAPALLVMGTNEGRYEQHLINTLGPVELWALSTSAEDVSIRNRLYDRLGARRARQLLASNFPGGSARSEIKRRVFTRAEGGETQTAAVSAVIEEIVEGLVKQSHENPEQDDGA
ncbi:MAG TPA: type IV secretion protein IcmB, partial [Alphaproteobacteria bacterium]